MDRVIVGLCVIALAGYLGSRTWRYPAASPPAQPIVTTAPAAPATTALPREVGTSGEQGQAQAADAPATSLRLEIDTTAPCWVDITADGRRIAYRVMQAGERQQVDAREDIVIRVGEPAALRYTINNRPGRALGRAGQPETVHITALNYNAFVDQ